MTLPITSRDDINKATGRRVQEIRKRRKLTQRQLAKLVGVHKITLSAYESGTHAIPTDKLILLAYHLRVRVGDLVPFNEVR